jgi:hypothetical protein
MERLIELPRKEEEISNKDSEDEDLRRKERKTRLSNHVSFSEKTAELFFERSSEEEDVMTSPRLQDLLNEIGEESLHLREFMMEENRLMNELSVAIKTLMKRLRVSFAIPPENIPVRKHVTKIVLNEDGYLILYSEKNELCSWFLAEYPPRIVMTILRVVMPKLVEVVKLYRERVSRRVGFFRQLKKELGSITSLVKGSKKGSDVR